MNEKEQSISETTYTNENGKIYITNPDWQKTAYTEYTPEIWQKINSTSWYLTGNEEKYYLRSSKLKRSLHQLVIEQWYGADILAKLYENGFVIDHLDNDGLNCNLSNLAFLSRKTNVAKGQTIDAESDSLLQHFALRIFNDFINKKYHITIASNHQISVLENGLLIDDFSRIDLLYTDDIDFPLIDTLLITKLFKDTGVIVLDKLHFINNKIDPIINIELTPEEIKTNPVFVIRNGEVLFLRNRVIHHSAIFDKDFKE